MLLGVLFADVKHLHAFEAGSPLLISHTPGGLPADGYCFSPKLSHTGRFVMFSCMALDVIPGEPGVGDAIRYDSSTQSLTGVSLTNNGEWGDCGGAELGTCSSLTLGLSDDGNDIVMNSGAPLTPDAPPPSPDFGRPSVFLRDVAAQTTVLLTPDLPGIDQYASPQGEDAAPERSEVLFATPINYLGGIDSNGTAADLYVKNWSTGGVELISTSPSDEQGDGDSLVARFSPDGRYVAFQSTANNLTYDNPQHLRLMFLRDRLLGTTRRLSFLWPSGEFVTAPQFTSAPLLTADNRHVVFSASGARFTDDDDPATGGIYDLDLVSNVVRLIPRAVDGGPLDALARQPAISADGRYLAFISSATNLTLDKGPLPAIFVQDRLTGETINVSALLGPVQSSIGVGDPSITLAPDGSKVAFDWTNFSTVDPSFAINKQVYTVDLHPHAAISALPVPSLSKWVCIGLSVAILFAAMLGASWHRCFRIRDLRRKRRPLLGHFFCGILRPMFLRLVSSGREITSQLHFLGSTLFEICSIT